MRFTLEHHATHVWLPGSRNVDGWLLALSRDL